MKCKVEKLESEQSAVSMQVYSFTNRLVRTLKPQLYVEGKLQLHATLVRKLPRLNATYGMLCLPI